MEYNFTYREKDKGFQVILSYKDNVGRWKQKSKQGFKTKREAKNAGDKLLEEVKANAPVYIDNSTANITFGEFAAIFLNDTRRSIAYNTILGYQHALKAFSELKDMRLVDITHSDILSIFNSLPVKANTANLYLVKLKTIFKRAVSPYELITKDPTAGIQPLKIKGQRKINALSKERLEAILARLKTKNYTLYTACCIAAFAGLRVGEIAALKWSDIDFNAGTLKVERQMVATNKNVMALQELKSNNSYRTVPIPLRLQTILAEYKNKYPRHISDMVFWNATYHSIKRVSQYTKGDISIHDFRHTYATTLLSSGFDIKTVAALLGDTVETVLKAYVHYTDEMRENAQKRLSNFF
jgi:integrase